MGAVVAGAIELLEPAVNQERDIALLEAFTQLGTVAVPERMIKNCRGKVGSLCGHEGRSQCARQCGLGAGSLEDDLDVYRNNWLILDDED